MAAKCHSNAPPSHPPNVMLEGKTNERKIGEAL